MAETWLYVEDREPLRLDHATLAQSTVVIFGTVTSAVVFYYMTCSKKKHKYRKIHKRGYVR